MPNTEETIKIMTFNIASGQKLDGILDLELTASVIEKTEIDIVGLQEVDQNFSQRSNFEDQTKWLADRLGMSMAYGPTISEETAGGKRARRQFGNAVLSKYPIVKFHNHPLTRIKAEGKNSEQRGLLETVIAADGFHMAFFNTHLSLNDEELEMHIEELLEITGQADMPVIIAGDFNADPRSSHIKKMKQHFSDIFGAAENHPSTYKKKGHHGEKIDYIFYDSNWQVQGAEIIETEASDHYPLLAELRFFTNL